MGKYPPPLPAILADSPDEVKTCVDLGCGSGSWYVGFRASRKPALTFGLSRILDVAHDFPNCSAVAVDLVPMQVL